MHTNYTTNQKKPKAFVMMSGGVDSSVSAALLKEQDYDVVGVFMKNWSDSSFFKDKSMCPWVTDQEDARKVAAVLDIPLYTLDFEKEYREKVVDYMVESYKLGITPNPDVMCNKEIKFGIFFEKAIAMGADFVATGHYARLCREIQISKSKFQKNKNDSILCHPCECEDPESVELKLDSRFRRNDKEVGVVRNDIECSLLAGIDKNKDQSYFLYTLKQEQLAKIIFPIGEYTKPEVRDLARKFNLPTAEKKDSQGVCFVGELDVFEFLKSEIPTKKGKIMTTDGKEIGEHQGVWFYTIGQRHGIGSLGGGEIYYVVSKDAKKNILYVGGKSDLKLYDNVLRAVNPHWINGIMPKKCLARIRYRQPLQECEVILQAKPVEDTGLACRISVKFDQPQRAIAPGQSIVFYDGDVVLGGAIITS